MSDRIDAVNAHLVEVCDNEGVCLINNDDVFKLRDGSINDGYFISDMTHPNSAGTSKLATSLGLNIMPEHRGDVTTSYSAAVRRPSADPGQSRAPGSSQRRQGRRRQGRSDRTPQPQPQPQPQRQSESRRDDQNASTNSCPSRSSRNDVSRDRDRHDDHSHSYGSDNGWSTVAPRRQSRPADNNREQTPYNRESRCEYCYERNHNKESCHHGQPVTCDICHRPGHKAKHHDNRQN